VSEIQVITTSAAPSLPEIQRITIDSDSNNLGGYFRLMFKGEMTRNILWNANAEGANSVGSALSTLSSCGVVSVSRQVSWRAVPGLTVNGTSGSQSFSVAKGSANSLVTGDIIMISGQKFTVTVAGGTTLTVSGTNQIPTFTQGQVFV